MKPYILDTGVVIDLLLRDQAQGSAAWDIVEDARDGEFGLSVGSVVEIAWLTSQGYLDESVLGHLPTLMPEHKIQTYGAEVQDEARCAELREQLLESSDSIVTWNEPYDPATNQRLVDAMASTLTIAERLDLHLISSDSIYSNIDPLPLTLLTETQVPRFVPVRRQRM